MARVRIFVSCMAAVMLATAGCSSSSSPGPTAAATEQPSPSALSGTAAILAAAGPLAAHIENTNQLICDSDQAYYEPNGAGGVAVVVDHFPPPGDLSITYTTKDQTGDGNQDYALQPGDTGHVFVIPGLAMSDVNQIDVNANAGGQAGTCQASPASS